MHKLVCSLALACALASAPAMSAPGPDAGTRAVASLDEAAWLIGRWAGTGMGGDVDEFWSPALGGQMVGHFRYAKDGEPGFYEIMMIDRTEAGIRMRVKHFDPDFTAWEDKAEWVEFEPVSTSPGQLRFNGLVLDRRIDGADEIMTATLRMRQKDGEVSDVVFTLKRVD